jgi:ACR3 family arsenite transporter
MSDLRNVNRTDRRLQGESLPILIQVFFDSGLDYLLNRAVGSPHCVAGPSAPIGASDFFELTADTAIALFGFNPGAVLATVVGVLIEVPVMLLVVNLIMRTQGWYESRPGISSYDDCCPPAAHAHARTRPTG